jgi:hypothetical protein
MKKPQKVSTFRGRERSQRPVVSVAYCHTGPNIGRLLPAGVLPPGLPMCYDDDVR